MTTTLFFFSLGCTALTVYTLYVMIRYGVRPSFSDTFYNTGALFPIVMGLMVLSFIIPILDATYGQWWQFVSLLTIAPIGFVGAAAMYKDGGLVYKVHMAAAWSSAVFSLVWITLASIYIKPMVALCVPMAGIIAYLGYLIDERQNKVWWAEYACFMWTIGGIAVALWG